MSSGRWLKDRTWEEFQQAGMIWLCNRILHLFGWAIAYDVDNDGQMSNFRPTRCHYRGFSPDVDGKGFQKVTKYMVDHGQELNQDCYL